jgi:hypothetical protein
MFIKQARSGPRICAQLAAGSHALTVAPAVAARTLSQRSARVTDRELARRTDHERLLAIRDEADLRR